MSTQFIFCRTTLVCLILAGLVPAAQARKDIEQDEQRQESSGKADHAKPSKNHYLGTERQDTRDRKIYDKTPRATTPLSTERKTHTKPQPSAPSSQERTKGKTSVQVPLGHERTPRTVHDRYYERYARDTRTRYYYYPHETYRYHTHYLAPIRIHYYPVGYRLSSLPRGYFSISIGGLPYFYFDGVFYRHYTGGYVVISAPAGARISVLPLGFITFNLGYATYYYVNDTYYLWDEEDEVYIVVKKPTGADKAIAEATHERLMVYPNKGQSEEQQARDRYECHRWAVEQSGVDPTLVDDNEITVKDRRDYKRAISACLEGRDYTVK